MAFIEPQEILLTAKLTRKGKQLRSTNSDRFLITKFGLGDEEIPYDLINDSDPDQSNIESIAIFEPSDNVNNIGSMLLRDINSLEDLIKAQTNNSTVPQNEYILETQIDGNNVFSLQNWQNDTMTIGFSIYDPIVQGLFLSNGFTIDFSNFYNNYQINSSGEGIAFNFTPIFPSATIGQINQYWFNSDISFLDKSNNILNVIIGIDDLHSNGIPLENLLNVMNNPVLTFKIQLLQTQLTDIYNFLLSNQLGSITDNLIISNNDTNLLPLTNYYGVNSTFSSIHAVIPITITF